MRCQECGKLISTIVPHEKGTCRNCITTGPSENKHEIKVETYWNTDGVITQDLIYPYDVTMRHIMDIREQQIRDALIALGWTPPKETK